MTGNWKGSQSHVKRIMGGKEKKMKESQDNCPKSIDKRPDTFPREVTKHCCGTYLTSNLLPPGPTSGRSTISLHRHLEGQA